MDRGTAVPIFGASMVSSSGSHADATRRSDQQPMVRIEDGSTDEVDQVMIGTELRMAPIPYIVLCCAEPYLAVLCWIVLCWIVLG